MQRYALTVTGKVQGVFFRHTARQVATGLGLAGFARNQPDGSVYIEIEGDESALQQFLAWCQTGPTHAQVATVNYTQQESANHSGFQIS
jgi:acylphosphatase